MSQTMQELREELESKHGPENVFNTEEVQEHFDLEGFGAPLCFGRRKSDNARAILQFNHMPRLYWLIRIAN